MRWKKEKVIRKGSALKTIFFKDGFDSSKLDELIKNPFFSAMEKDQLPRRSTEVMYINFQTISKRSYTETSTLDSKFTVNEVLTQLKKGVSEIETRFKQFKEFGDFKNRPRLMRNFKVDSDKPFKKESIYKITFNYVN